MEVKHMELASVIIAGIALLVSIISLIKSNKAQKLQNKLNELDCKIKEYELSKIEENKAKSSESCVEARMVHIAKGKNRLKIWNSGNTTAYNVNATIQKDSNIFLIDREKLPFEQLEPQKSFEIVAVVSMNSASKFYITTEWTDEEGNQKTKEQLCTI